MGDRYQFIPYFEASGAVQMALDAWLLEQHLAGRMPPTLRFYGWQPAAISLGYHQRRWPDHWSGLVWQDRPIDLVRRPSGGRAVLHQGDLTYGVVSDRFQGKRTAVYAQICEFLIKGWQRLGVSLSYGSAGRGYIHNPNCFGTATGADLVLENGAKFIGSAQLWRAGAVLQHGSMRLNPDPALLQSVFGGSRSLPEFPELPEVPELPKSFQGEAGRQQIIEALVTAAADCWDVAFERRELTPGDWAEVQAILDRSNCSASKR